MRRAIAWFAENHVAANLLMVLIVAGGIAALPAIEQRTFPEFDSDIVQVGVTYLGAAPEEVEEGVCVRIEEEVSDIEGVDRITSTAAEGACGVSLEILSGYPIDRALSEIKNAVDGISTFPEETEKPVVNHLALRSVELQIALSGRVPERTLKFYGEKLRDDITAATEVTQAELSSARDYEISIEVPEQSLRRHGLTFDQVVEAVRRSSLDLPGGSLKTDAGEILLRAKGQAYSGEQFERIVVHTRDDGTRLLLGEVASVVDGFEEDPRFARFDGKPAVMVQIFRVGDQKVLDLVAQVKEFLTGAVERLPEGIHATVWRDGSQYLRERLGILIRNGVGGFLLVFALLALFLRLRLAFWVALGIPLSFLGALWLFPVLDVSIDVLSLFAFILVLGILVDDAIVVGENVHSHQERSEEPLAAAIRGTQEVAVPVIFGVLTTVAAFLPMIVSPGRMGQLFGTIGVVVLCCLFFSLVESQWILPAHLGHLATVRERPARRGSVRERWKALQARLGGSLSSVARNLYRPALERALHWRYASVAVGLAMLMVMAAVVGAGLLKFSFFPVIESDYVTASVTLPQGSPPEVTAAAVATLEDSLRRAQAAIEAEQGVAPGSLVKHVLSSVGEQPSVRGGPPLPDEASASHLGQVSVELGSGDERPLSSREITDRWRAATPPLPDVEELVFNSQYLSLGNPIDVELRSADTQQLERAAERLKEHLATYPGVFDVADSFLAGKEEIELAILPSAQTLGLTLDDLARQVRQAFYGEEVQRIQRGRDDVRVMVRYPQSQRRSLSDLDDLRIRTPEGGEVPFYAVARAERGRGFASIKRANRQRVVDVTADIDPEITSANRVLAELQRSFLRRLLAEHPGLSYGLEGEQREQRKTLTALIRNYSFALVLIYALLAVPLRSYVQPLLIMAVIPFGLVGAIAGHLIMGLDHLSMMSVFGCVALSGVVVNASLVLVHRVNELRDAGTPLAKAVRDAGVARFRPIVLTSLTTFAGLTPLLLERAMGAQFLIPMATSLAFGVAFATVISLFLVPCGYLILEDLSAVLGRSPRPGAPGDAESGVGTVVELGRRR